MTRANLGGVLLADRLGLPPTRETLVLTTELHSKAIDHRRLVASYAYAGGRADLTQHDSLRELLTRELGDLVDRLPVPAGAEPWALELYLEDGACTVIVSTTDRIVLVDVP